MSMITDIVKYYKAAYEVRSRIVWFPNTIVVGEWIVYHDSITVLGLGCQIASAMTMPDGREIIIVDDSFLTMSKETQIAIVCHELGHFHYKHKERPFIRSLKMTFGIVSQNEIEADAYAANVIGVNNMIRALHELYTFTKQREIKQRIKILQKRSVSYNE